MKKEFAKSYNAIFAPDGCVYRQNVNITEKNFIKVLKMLEKEAKKHSNFWIGRTKKLLIEKDSLSKGMVFPNLTQSAFIAEKLGIKIKKDRNVCFTII